GGRGRGGARGGGGGVGRGGVAVVAAAAGGDQQAGGCSERGEARPPARSPGPVDDVDVVHGAPFGRASAAVTPRSQIVVQPRRLCAFTVPRPAPRGNPGWWPAQPVTTVSDSAGRSGTATSAAGYPR